MVGLGLYIFFSGKVKKPESLMTVEPHTKDDKGEEEEDSTPKREDSVTILD